MMPAPRRLSLGKPCLLMSSAVALPAAEPGTPRKSREMACTCEHCAWRQSMQRLCAGYGSTPVHTAAETVLAAMLDRMVPQQQRSAGTCPALVHNLMSSCQAR